MRNKVRIEKDNFFEIGEGTRIKGTFISIVGKNNCLMIKDKVKIRDSHIEIYGENCRIEIGSNTLVGHDSYLSAKEKNVNLVIGKACALSRNIKLMTSDGHDILQSGKRINQAKNIYIMDHVWLADNVTVLKGVTIGEGSIVGINSVITKSIKNNVLAAGNPAKVVKEQITHRDELTY
ncbi:MAG: acyltransferase [Nitrospiria bacterium]